MPGTKSGNKSRLTDEERAEQLIHRVYGNLAIERPHITLAFVRERFEARREELLRRYVADHPLEPDNGQDRNRDHTAPAT
jgi:hypothetical protein